MTPEQQRPWDEWLNASVRTAIQERLEFLAGIIGGECGLIEKRLTSEIKALREEIAALRCDVEILRQHKAANVTPIGQRNVA